LLKVPGDIDEPSPDRHSDYGRDDGFAAAVAHLGTLLAPSITLDDSVRLSEHSLLATKVDRHDAPVGDADLEHHPRTPAD
jgi:hypothetical protein